MASTGSVTLARRGLKALETLTALDGRSPNAVESEALAGWPGWGPLAPAFDPDAEGTWASISDQLADLLTPRDLTLAAEAVDNSFYTPDLVVDAVYSLLADAGFAGGRILEPGCGSGTFMRRVPAGWDVKFTGVEKDPVSARIAAALHPEATILQGRYEKLSPKAGFDAVVGNVPFSSTTVYDKASGLAENLHNYFVLRSLQLLREGGYLGVVTSRYAIDSDESIIRKAASTADFVGAMRLPTGTFHGEGTDVVADIVILRRNTTRPRTGWTGPAGEADETGLYSSFAPQRTSGHYASPYYGARREDRSAKVHQYWAEHPAHVAGELEATGNFHNPIKVTATDVPAAIEAARAALAGAVAAAPMFEHAIVLDTAGFEDADGRTEGSFHVIDGVMMRVDGGKLAPVKGSKELHALVGLRELAIDLLAAESDPHAPAASMAVLRADTLAAYQAYVAKFGPLNRGTLHEGPEDPETGAPSQTWRRPTLGGFRRDPDYLKVMALEHYDQATDTAEPAAILLHRVNAAPEPVTSADTAGEALAISLGETGRVDLPRIAGLLSLPDARAALAALGKLVIADPEDGGRTVPARDYLSGDVRAKLDAARAAARRDHRYEANVAALEDVLPADLGPNEIRMMLGSPCLAAQDIRDFLEEVVGGAGSVTHFAPTATWTVDAPYTIPAEAATTWGTSKMNAYELVKCALNGKAPVVYEDVFEQGRGWRKVRNAEQTVAAQEKTNEIQDRFGVWAWEDPARSARLCAEYNRRFNSFVPRVSDGSHLTFPSLSGDLTPHPWQRDIVDKIVSTPAVLCGHAVGSGKTLSMALSAFTLKRFGLARKPLVIVPNHLLEQIAREMQQAFPLGKFLIAGKEDLAKDTRRLFAARCATGDWDAVVMTHQGFTSLPVHADTEIAWLEAQKDEYDAHLRSEIGGYAGAKEIARKIRSFESKLEKVRDNQNTDPDQILFEHLGIDYLAVDEAHAFKRLGTVSSRSEGFSMGSSKRATDLLLKAETLRDRKPGKPYLGLFTGTPWSNTLAETFVWQKFLQPDVLARAGVADFDAWAAVFVKRETVVEVAPDGSGFRTTTRPTRMMNLPELKTMLGQVADILTADDLGLERPERVTKSISVEQTPGQAAYVAGLIERAENLRTGSSGQTNDNMLVICGEGRRVALDPRLVGVAEDSPKIAALADAVAHEHRTYKDTRYGASPVPGPLQVVFCDQGTPNKDHGAQTYGRVREALIARGIPAASIRMIHEAKDDKARAALFSACRDGSVSVLIGSTEKMGTGVNIQTRLAALHHLDAPWRPSDVEQRDGRADRPHNLNTSVTYYRYVTVRTFDAYMWQALERKAIAFAAMYARSSSVRETEDVGTVVAPDFSEMKALASGSPLLLEQAKISATVKKLRTLRAVDAQSVVAARKQITAKRREAETVKAKLSALTELAASDERSHDPHGFFPALVRDARQSAYGRYGRDWRGLQVRVDGDGSRGLSLEFRYRYHTLDHVTIHKPSIVLKGRTERAVELVRDIVTDWEANLGGFEDGQRKLLASLETEVGRAQAVVDGYRFSREGELREAEDRLAEIDRELAAEADVLEEVAA